MTSTSSTSRLIGAWQVAALLAVLVGTPVFTAAQSMPPYASGVFFAVPVPASQEPAALSAAPPLGGANITVNSPTAGQQNETSITVNLNNPSNLIGGANDYRHGDSRCGRYFTTNNGG